MRILFVAPYVPSPIRVRPFQLVRQLARMGHRITLVALDDGTADAATRAELTEICERVEIVPHSAVRGGIQAAVALPTPTPLWSAFCRSPRLARILQTLLADSRYDIAHVEHLRAAHFGRYLGGLPAVFDAVDCITALQRQMLDQADSWKGRLLAWEEWSKLRRFEPWAYRGFGQIAVTSRYDADELQLLSADLPPIIVVPNGVDLEYFQPSERAPMPDTLVFSGKMSYRANDDAACFLATEILPRVRERRPNATLTIAGSGPSSRVRELAGDRNITVTGYVEDLRPFLADAAIAVCPMRIGVGIQNKALEAMAMGRPVVCSPIAGRALTDATASGGVRIAASAEAFADACVALLERPERATEAGSAARRYVEGHHRWECAADAFVDLYERARGAGVEAR